MFSQTTEYALRAMAILAYTPDELVATPLLAERTQVPSNYLAKVLQVLAGADLIVGRRGVGGGYKLARSPHEIALLDVINAVSPVEPIHSCPLGLSNHGPNLCPLHRKMDEAARMIIDHFEGISLHDLIADEKAQSRPLCDTKATQQLKISAKK